MMIGVMPQAKDTSRAVQFELRPETFRDLVRRLAADTANIKWSQHALDRMDERGITDKTVLDVLRLGDVRGSLEAGRSAGEWKGKMVRQVNGRREVGAIVVTVRNARLFLKTVEWEDPK